MQTRRKFLENTGKGALGLAVAGTLTHLVTPVAAGTMVDTLTLSFSQDPLAYSYDALDPNIDAVTMEIHYTKHHTAYIKSVNEAIVAEGISDASPQALFTHISQYSAKARNNAGGAWNHNFFWASLSPKSSVPTGKLADALNSTFGSLDAFKEKFSATGASRFGSGWAWLIDRNGKLEVTSTPNQDNPLMDVAEVRGTPLLGLDVWEHAYYLKYQNRRPDYIKNWWNVVDWEKVAERLG